MKVLLLNGSPRKAGCTFTALSTVAKALEENGIETEIFQAGNPKREHKRGCIKAEGSRRLNCRLLPVILGISYRTDY